MAKLRRQLEEETLARVDMENKNQSLREALQFKTSVYEKEVAEVSESKRVQLQVEESKMRAEYDSKLVAELQHIRQQADDKIDEMRSQVEKRYHNKLGRNFSIPKLIRESNCGFKWHVLYLGVKYLRVYNFLFILYKYLNHFSVFI